uniref:Fe2OG dioxygenase domain-containing protein n=1 Tax=Salix viminalis TaxID=40686 RepID=A0A6N2MWM9_SALVM
MSGYIEAVRGLACELLDLMAEGLWVPDRSVFSRLIRGDDSDSILRLNHYPPMPLLCKDKDSSSPCNHSKVGFGEHSDPQILTILRSNDVGGLQISLNDGAWVPVTPDPTAFCVNVGDLLQAMTNGRFVSVRHKAMINSYKSRMSMAYFAAPPLDARIAAPPEMVTPTKPALFRPFTWAEFKKAVYALRLGDSRLGLFTTEVDEHILELQSTLSVIISHKVSLENVDLGPANILSPAFIFSPGALPCGRKEPSESSIQSVIMA